MSRHKRYLYQHKLTNFFSEDKTPLQVAIELKLEADEVNKYHKEKLTST